MEGNSVQSSPSVFPLSSFQPLDDEGARKRRRSERRDSEENETSEEILLLRDIQVRLRNMEEKIDTVSTDLKLHLQSCSDVNMKTLEQDVVNIKTKLNSTPTITHPTQETRLNESLNTLKYRCIPKWGSMHRARREGHYKSIAAEEKSIIMENYLSGPKPYIMKKYRKPVINGETTARYKIREKLSIAEMRADIETAQVSAQECKVKYEKVDEDLFEICETLLNEEEKIKLKELWMTEVKAAESKSAQYWHSQKAPWWFNRPEMDPYIGQPKSGPEKDIIVVTQEPSTSRQFIQKEQNEMDDGFREPRYNLRKNNWYKTRSYNNLNNKGQFNYQSRDYRPNVTNRQGRNNEQDFHQRVQQKPYR